MVWGARGTLLVNHFRVNAPGWRRTGVDRIISVARHGRARPVQRPQPGVPQVWPSPEVPPSGATTWPATATTPPDNRDTTADDRDDTAGQRDTTAAVRDEDTRRELAILDERLLTIREQNSTDPATANLTQPHRRPPQRAARPAGRRREAAADRHAAARDRRHAARDRDGSAQDRAAAAQDRDQAAIERAQDGSPQPTQIQNRPPGHEHPVSHTPQALAESRRRITASREQLDRTRPAGPGRDVTE